MTLRKYFQIQFIFVLKTLIYSKSVPYRGTGHEVWGNCNAPRAITLSALIYCLRSIVGRDMPLNQVN